MLPRGVWLWVLPWGRLAASLTSCIGFSFQNRWNASLPDALRAEGDEGQRFAKPSGERQGETHFSETEGKDVCV